MHRQHYTHHFNKSIRNNSKNTDDDDAFQPDTIGINKRVMLMERQASN
jgi:hypothetical protein